MIPSPVKSASRGADGSNRKRVGKLTLLRLILAIFGALPVLASGQEEGPEATPAAAAGESEARLNINQIRVRGAKLLSGDEIASAIYDFTGPNRTVADLEAARQALEQAYRDKGFQTVTVEIPPQNGTRGIIYMDAIENEVGRLRVRGSRFYLPSAVKRAAPSLAEGTVPDFNEVQKDILALNAWPGRRVTPVVQPGKRPGTIDVDLNVEDEFPLHGSIELNNRYSPDTTPLRVNASLSYNNLWQLGHSIGFAAQVAPERIEDAEVYSAYYIARFAKAPNFSLMVSGTKQNSDISTLGGAAVVGRGEVLGLRAMLTLPARGNYFHSVSTGFDYKSFDENITLDDEIFSTPIDYYPFTIAYGGGLTGENFFTEINTSINFHFRGMGSRSATFDNKRYLSDGSYIYFRGDLSHTHDLPGGFQAFAKIQGQATNDSLINSEQYAGGGLSTVRGYLESEALGDSGWFVTTELRSPSLLSWAGENELGDPKHEWRFHVFYDGGRLYLNEALPEQIDLYELSSVGVGSSLHLWDHFHGYVDVAWPMDDISDTPSDDPFWSFRVRADF
ncbi:MAG: ShlB/FhaC/HecB family hemolysin secretion/activation protein [Verrucomicrobiae bacterium]|nr:ShlB/FhaC/HecB family hemolysin secretion/activation protein [Verrucomicrobiae bacterium]